MNANREASVLVTGAGGQLGQRAVAWLLDAGVHRVVAGTRSPERATQLRSRGVEVRHLDFDDADSMSAALRGVDRVLLVSTDVVSPAGRRVAQHRAMIEAAAHAGVEHLVYTSFARAEADSPISLTADHHATEMILQKSGLSFTALRNSLYAESLVRRVPALLEAGEAVGLAGAGGIAYISRSDCADAAAAATASLRPPRGAAELTGPEVLTEAQWTALAGKIAGKPIGFVGLQPGALLEHLVASGMAKGRAEWKVAFDTAVADGWLSFTTTQVEALTGRTPRRVREVLQAAFAPRVPA